MKVALVHDFLKSMGGAERVLSALSEVYPDAPIYTLFYDKKSIKGYFDEDKIMASKLQKYRWRKNHHKYLLPKMSGAIEQFDLSGFDVVISSSAAWSKGILTKPETLHICYCHTPTRFLWDWHHQYLSEEAGVMKKMILGPMLKKLRIWDKIAADRPDVFVANSVNTAIRIKKYYRREAEIIYPPVEVDSKEVSSKSKKYFLIVSRLSPYKNVELAVRTFNNLGLPLKIVGEGRQKRYLEKIAQKNIEFLGFLPDKDVEKLYSECRAFIFTPEDEDFGITPVEAMAYGKPVIARRRGGPKETIKEGVTGEFFGAPTEDALALAVKRFISNEQNYDSREIRKHAEKFDKQIFQQKIKHLVESRVKNE